MSSIHREHHIAGRVIHTFFEHPPIPIRDFDWGAADENYDGAPDSRQRQIGWGRSEHEAIADLLEQLEVYP